MNKLERRQEGIKRARRLMRVYRSFGVPGNWYDEDGMIFKRAIHTRVPCSCWMCRNPRKSGEVTYQEKKADLDLQDE